MAIKPHPALFFTADSTSEELAAFDGKAYAEEMRQEMAEERKRLGLPTIQNELDAWVWKPNDDWRKLEGLLAHSVVDTSEQAAAERAWELAHDERKFGSVSRK